MNATRLLLTLANVNTALKQAHRYSNDQLKVYRKSKRKLLKQLKQFTDPAAPARPLPPQRNQLRLL